MKEHHTPPRGQGIARPRRVAVLAFAAAAGCAAPAFSGIAIEFETNGAIVNNDVFGAQALDASLFTANQDANVFGTGPTVTILGKGGGNDVDFYRFDSLTAGSAFYADIDGAGFDTYLALFASDGTLLADSDDSFPADPGSSTHLDAFLGTYVLGSVGTYYLAVSRSGNFANATFSGSSFAQLTRPDGVFGGFGFVGATSGDSSFLESGTQLGVGYTLHLTVVPAPGAAALVVAAFAPVARRRRRAAL
jgi:hypothetical protein